MKTRSSADADNRLNAFSGQSRSTNMVPWTPSHVAVAITLNAQASSLKKKGRKKDAKTVANWLFAQTTHVVGSKSHFAWWVACGV